MQIYVFSSNNLTNIWAGVGAGMWAVSLKLAKNKGTITKSQRMQIGSVGVLYCSETEEFTTPFLVKSLPDTKKEISHVWDKNWGLPFKIAPLGSPIKRLSKNVVAKELPSVTSSGKNWNKILYVQPNFSFQPSTISTEDWAFIYASLCD
ncbi:MAG: hypothetical protein QOF62_1876 [Pyrinomonadaceae bacterium]|jgi:hypothetical protein|nr:hypothetical protein [Pyrinomonadaceae bacterium]